MTIALLILAAGASTRMGTPKQLLPIQGKSLIRRLGEMAIASQAHPVVVILGAYAEQIQVELNDLSLHVIHNAEWAEGMGTSVRCGMQFLETLPKPIEAVILTVCDQPFLSTAVINQLLTVYQSQNHAIIASEYAATVGVPALFSRQFFPILRALNGAEGAKQVMRKYGDQVYRVPFSEGAIDLDTPEEYEAYLNLE
jgi:molybdenum cofactor cytidylyltransferase